MLTAISRRTLGLATLATAAWTSSFAHAQTPAAADWPQRPVRFVNAFPPGGPSDTLARTLAEALQTRFKQAFIVENKPGAAGNLGTDMVAKSAGDGYTVLFGIDSTFTVNPHIYKDRAMPFKPSDLKPVMLIGSSGLLVGTHPGAGFKTLGDLVAAGQSKGVSFSSAGSGSPGHLAAEVFTEATGMKINHIPYKGNTPAVTAVLAGEVDGGVLATPGMLPHVKAGKINALAVTSRQRSPMAPDVPTVAQAGLKELEQEVIYLAMVPASTPEAVVQKLQQAMAEALARPEMRARMTQLDMAFEGLTGAAAVKRLADLSNRYAQVIRATGMKVE